MPTTTNEINCGECHAITYSMLEENCQRNTHMMELDSEESKIYVKVLCWHKKFLDKGNL
jgi:hypothetical protein